MIYITGIAVLFGLVAGAFAAKFYIELHKWARMCQNTTIAVEYKNKVKLNASFVEWMLWTRQLKKEDKGRAVYAMGGTRIAILKGKDTQPLTKFRTPGRATVKPSETHAPRSRQGVWSKETSKSA